MEWLKQYEDAWPLQVALTSRGANRNRNRMRNSQNAISAEHQDVKLEQVRC